MRCGLLIAASLVLASQPTLAQDAGWQADAVARAVDYHLANPPEPCLVPDRSIEPAHFELQIGEETAARQALLIELPCQIGAYNQTAIYLLSDQHGTVSEVVFPSPQVDVRYAGEGDSASVEDVVITETPELREVVNPSYDPDSRTMTERNKWRGAGDAYGLTQWGFKNGKFAIMLFAVDASFDGKDNPQTLIENDIW
jgi:hypothetical protein